MSQKDLRILFLFWGRMGGGAKYSLEIAKELSQKEDVNLHISISNQCKISEDFKELGLPGLYVDTYESVPGFINKWVFRKHHYKKKVRDYLKKHNIGLMIIAMDFFWGKVLYKAAEEAGVKTIYVVHEPKPHPQEPFFIGMVMRRTLRTLITGADHLVTLTSHVKNYLKEHYHIKESNVSIIPHGIFTYFKASGPKTLPENGPVKILYFGTITYYKGLDILLRAFSILEKKYDFIQLEIWGSGNLSEHRALIDDLKNVRIENRWIAESEIEDIFKQSHICVLPYRDASQSGIVGVASSAAMPIVACPAEGLKEQLEEASVLFSEDFTPEALSASIEKLLTRPEYYSELSESILYYAEKFSWSAIASQFRDIGEQLLSKK